MSQCCNHEAMRKQMHENHKGKNNAFVQMVSNFLFKHLSWGCQKKQAELHWWKTAAHHSNWAIMPKKVRKLQYEWFVPRNDSLKISRYKWKTETNNFLLDTNGLCKVREDYVAIKCLWVPWTDCLALGNWFQHHSFQSWCNVNIFKATDTKTGKPNGFGRPIINFENSRAQMFNLCLVKTCFAMDFCQGSVLLLKNWVW